MSTSNQIPGHGRAAALRRARRCLGPLLLLLVVARPAAADVWQPLAAWRITAGRVAPWAPAGTRVDAALRGRDVRFDTARLVAPPPLACDGVTYEWRMLDAAGLFEGNLPAPAAASARQLGLGAGPFPTLRVTCANAGFDFHRTARGDLLLGLDHVVWTLQAAASATTPAEVVQELLLTHFSHDMGFTRESVAHKRAFLSARLRTAIARYVSIPASPNEAPEVNGDPFTDTQEYPDRFTLGPVRVEAQRAIVPVHVADGRSSRRVDYVVVREGTRWRVDDIVDARGESLRQLMDAVREDAAASKAPRSA